MCSLQAPESTDVGTCGPNFNSYYSWGGRSVYDSTDGQYHLFASFMCNVRAVLLCAADCLAAAVLDVFVCEVVSVW